MLINFQFHFFVMWPSVCGCVGSGPKISVFGGLTTKIEGNMVQTPKMHTLDHANQFLVFFHLNFLFDST